MFSRLSREKRQGKLSQLIELGNDEEIDLDNEALLTERDDIVDNIIDISRRNS